ncbi:MAG: DUF1476 domain-containing protein [Acetobacteraceae bacterium]|nr:DUF1476 domain-containing protein [Acetobacteraceae bacterium]
MSTDAFADRQKGFEAKYKLDQEQEFRAQSRRNRLFGLWVAGKLGKQGTDAEAYAREVIASDMQKPGHDDVIGKVSADLDKAGRSIAKADLEAEYVRLLAEARGQVAAETPKG